MSLSFSIWPKKGGLENNYMIPRSIIKKKPHKQQKVQKIKINKFSDLLQGKINYHLRNCNFIALNVAKHAHRKIDITSTENAPSVAKSYIHATIQNFKRKIDG